MKKIEEYGKIVSAALLNDNHIYISKKGHHDIFTMEKKGILRSSEQGFVTENGYFVDRKKAYIIALYYHQIEKKHNPIDSLNSEDLKKDDTKILKKQKNYEYFEKKSHILERDEYN